MSWEHLATLQLLGVVVGGLRNAQYLSFCAVVGGETPQTVHLANRPLLASLTALCADAAATAV